MYDYALSQLIAYGPLLAVAVVAWWAMLYWLDHRGRINFRARVLPVILESSIGSGLYFGCRCIAVALLVSAVFSAVRF